jgi:hypothetical protein
MTALGPGDEDTTEVGLGGIARAPHRHAATPGPGRSRVAAAHRARRGGRGEDRQLRPPCRSLRVEPQPRSDEAAGSSSLSRCITAASAPARIA